MVAWCRAFPKARIRGAALFYSTTLTKCQKKDFFYIYIGPSAFSRKKKKAGGIFEKCADSSVNKRTVLGVLGHAPRKFFEVKSRNGAF